MLSTGICTGNLLVLSSPSAVVELSRDRQAAGDTESDSVKIGHDAGGTDDSENDNGSIKSISRRSLLANVLCGDFIKVVYPFME